MASDWQAEAEACIERMGVPHEQATMIVVSASTAIFNGAEDYQNNLPYDVKRDTAYNVAYWQAMTKHAELLSVVLSCFTVAMQERLAAANPAAAETSRPGAAFDLPDDPCEV